MAPTLTSQWTGAPCERSSRSSKSGIRREMAVCSSPRGLWEPFAGLTAYGEDG